MWRRWKLIRWGKLLLLRFIRLQGTPHEISKGVALGIFIGMTPTFGFQMAIAVFFAWLLRESKLAAVLGVWITNPVTAPVIYALEYETGRAMLRMPHFGLPETLTFATLGQLSWDVLLPFFLGSAIWSVFSWIAAYWICLKLTPLTRKIRLERWPRPRPKSLPEHDDQA